MLEGELVRLRAREMADLERAHRWVNDPEVTRFLKMRYPISMTIEERWLSDNLEVSYPHVRLAIEVKENAANHSVLRVKWPPCLRLPPATIYRGSMGKASRKLET